MSTKLNSAALSKTNKRLEAAPKGEMTKWLIELERITDKNFDSGAAKAECLTWFVNRLSVAFAPDDKYDTKVGDNLLKRAQSISATEGKAWQEALEGILKTKIGKAYSVPLVLIPVDVFYEDNKYSVERAKKYQARLKQLTVEDLVLWTKNVDEFGGTEVDGAVNIILLDGFFEKEQFQRIKFKTAVEPNKK